MSKVVGMDGTPVADRRIVNVGGGGDNGGMDDIARRVGNLETDVRSIKETLSRLEPRIIEMHAFATTVVPTLATKADVAKVRASLTEATALIPSLATKADVADVRALLADKPGKGYLWAVLGVLVASILAAVALGVTVAPLLSKASS